jgi:hypothetical protein
MDQVLNSYDELPAYIGINLQFVLFPQGLAIPLTSVNKRRLEVLKQRRAERESLTNPTTGLPSGKLIEEQLRLLMRKKNWETAEF